MGKKGNGEWFTEPTEQTEQQSRCPKCYAVMTDAAVLCMLCGYNRSTGNYVELPSVPSPTRPRKQKQRITFRHAALCVFILVASAAAYTYLCYESFMLKHRKHLPKSLAYKLPEHLDRKFNPLWLKDFKYKSINKAFQHLVEDEMDANYPLFRHDEEVELELTSGKTRPGIFKTANEKCILIYAGDEMVELPFSELKSKSRIRCDRAERKTIRNRVAHDRALTFLMGSGQEPDTSTSSRRTNGRPILGKQEAGSQNKRLSN